MTIDEAIKFCHEKSENIKLKAEPQVFIDIENMLKELKIYKECNISKANFSIGYNKAIDDFASELENHSISADTGKGNTVKIEFVAPVTRIIEVAEQLKKGDSDGM